MHMDTHKHNMCMYFYLKAASLLIASNWNSAEVPTIGQWRWKMYQMFLVAKLTTMLKVRRGVYRAVPIF